MKFLELYEGMSQTLARIQDAAFLSPGRPSQSASLNMPNFPIAMNNSRSQQVSTTASPAEVAINHISTCLSGRVLACVRGNIHASVLEATNYSSYLRSLRMASVV
jgi:hypothetical protein